MSLNPSPVPLKPKRRRRQNVFKFYSPKCQREVEVESFVEYIVWLSYEFDANTTFMCERPGELVAPVDGKSQKYTPDLFVRTANDEEYLIEAKKDEDLVESDCDDRVPKRWPIISAIADHYGLPLRVVTDLDFSDRQISVANWREALPYAADESLRPRYPLRESVLSLFSEFQQLTLGEISSSLPDWPPSECHSSALWHVHQGRLAMEWNTTALDRTTLLRLNDQTG